MLKIRALMMNNNQDAQLKRSSKNKIDSFFDIISSHPDVGLSVPGLALKNGYPIEVHTVITEDNYLLTVHRIPYGKFNKKKKNRKPVFLMHGILESSADWVLLGPERSLGYLLAEMGYDVWLGNARGNTYSRRHSYLDPDKNANKYWDFSWHEIGLYDLPATIDYILARTNNKQIIYVGHSQGCTSFFVMTSLRPKYNQKIKVMFALAPAVFMGHAKNPFITYAAKYFPITKLIFRLFSRYEFWPNKKLIRDLIGIFCKKQSPFQSICEKGLYLFTGNGAAQMDKERLPVMLGNTPAGCSTKQLIHFLQNTRSKKNLFSQFDYGPQKNLDKYRSLHPPEYSLKRVTTPVALFSSYNDIFVDIKDVDKLNSILPNVILNYHVPLKQFTHLDFVWAKDIVPLVYNKMFTQLKTNK